LNSEYRTVLGVRAAGLLLVGLGIPVIDDIIVALMTHGWTPTPDGSGMIWRFETLLQAMQDKAAIITFVSSTGLHFASVVAGLYLLRSNPWRLVRRGASSA
jgi:hypothetical protein